VPDKLEVRFVQQCCDVILCSSEKIIKTYDMVSTFNLQDRIRVKLFQPSEIVSQRNRSFVLSAAVSVINKLSVD